MLPVHRLNYINLFLKPQSVYVCMYDRLFEASSPVFLTSSVTKKPETGFYPLFPINFKTEGKELSGPRYSRVQ